MISDFISQTNPDEIISGLGGNGLAFVFRGKAPGPTILFRAELDALPVQEINAFDYRSDTPDYLAGFAPFRADLAIVLSDDTV